MQKLGKNNGSYYGEQIDIAAVVRDIRNDAPASGWNFEPILATPTLEIDAWHRKSLQPRRRIYLSTGIHGDEPAGPLAIRELIRENAWPQDADITVCPCLNPTGFPINRRENLGGFDLNRQYIHIKAEETRAHIDWLQRQPAFDVTLCLHEDWESLGFYLYELNPDNRPSHAEEMIRRVSAVCPIDLSPEIEGRPAEGGIIHPNIDPRSRPEWPEAFWLLSYKTRHSYTLESPSDFLLTTRVNALVQAVKAVLEDTRT